jgi:hypothetical protein
MSKRYLKVRHIFQLLRKRTGIFVCLTFIFVSMAVVQRWFIHAHLYQTSKQELASWSEQVANEIAYRDRWDLGGYRRASITAPSWYIIAKDGLIVDVEGFIPGLFGKVELPDEAIFSRPQTVTSAVGETWRLAGRKVVGGSVIVGINLLYNPSDADTELLANLKRFGSTIDQATSLKTREIDLDVEYAVVSSNGELKAAWGGLPLKTNPQVLQLSYDHLTPFVSNNKSYLLYSRPIRDSRGQNVGTIIIPKEMGLEQEAVRAQDKFNYWVVVITALLTCAIAFWLVAHDLFSQTKRVSLEEALRVGESRTIEFKSSFQWDIKQQKYIEERRLDILKSIAGFLNSGGGTLFIGVTEDTQPPTVCGLDEDLKLCKGSEDKLKRTLRDLITERIGSEFSFLISDSLEESGGRLYWMVVVQKSPGPAFVRWKGQEQNKFYVREGPKTSDLDIESALRYIKNRWG